MKISLVSIILLVFVFANAPAQLTITKPEFKQVPVQGYAQSPILSPDGRHIAFSRENLTDVSVINLEDYSQRFLSASTGAGWGAVWLDNTHFVMRGTQPDQKGINLMGVEVADIQSGTTAALIPFAPANRIEVPLLVGQGKVLLVNGGEQNMVEVVKNQPAMRKATVQDAGFTFRSSNVRLGTRNIQAPGNRQLVSIIWSQDESRALVELYGQPSLYLLSAATGSFSLLSETGERPSWLTNDLAVFMETRDDGYVITEGNIILASTSRGTKQNLTQGQPFVAINPSVAVGSKVAFNTSDGKLFVINLALRK